MSDTEIEVVGDEKYILLGEIASGNFGKVYKAADIQRKEIRVYAVKRFKITKIKYEKLLTEIDILEKVSDGFYINKFHEAYETFDHYNLVLDYLPFGDLYNFFLKEEYDLTSDEYRYLAAELVVAINFLHSHEVLHLDLKPANVLISNSGHCAIADFGSGIQLDKNVLSSELVGTIDYISPEIILGHIYSFATDFWSLGILLHMIITKYHPFSYVDFLEECSISDGDTHHCTHNSDNSHIMGNYEIIGCQPIIDEILEPELRNFIKGLLEDNPEKRLGTHPEKIFELMYHPYFTRIFWEDIKEGKGHPPFITYLEILSSKMEN